MPTAPDLSGPDSSFVADAFREKFREILKGSTTFDEVLDALEDIVQDRMQDERVALHDWVLKAYPGIADLSIDERFEQIKNRWANGPAISANSGLVAKFDFEDVQWLVREVERLRNELDLTFEMKTMALDISGSGSAKMGAKIAVDDNRFAVATAENGDVMLYGRDSGEIIGVVKNRD